VMEENINTDTQLMIAIQRANWSRRSWVRQEVILGKQLYTVIGNKLVPFLTCCCNWLEGAYYETSHLAQEVMILIKDI